MNNNLLIIESPNKIATLKKYLGDDFNIIATIGHIRDLPRSKLGFNQETYEPEWVIPRARTKGKFKEKSKKDIIQQINKAAVSAESIYLASDPDREGEAISWHVYESLDETNKKKCKRITFNEISKEAINEALKNPREIDIAWVESQFTRRILDRMIGYRLSKLVKKTVRADSAGRVQSVALKFIEDREKEIEAFTPTKWWTIDTVLENDIPLVLRSISPTLNLSDLSEQAGQSGIDFNSYQSAELVKKLLSDYFTVYAIDPPETYTRNPKEPYKTSTLQQDAVNKLGWQAKKIMMIAQKLYEGVGSGNDHQAYISYPRTDSTRMSDSFLTTAKKYINDNYGSQYLNINAKTKVPSNNNIQDAHEAIRPVNVNISPESIKSKIGKDEYALYKLIWLRTVSSLMSPAKYERTVVRFENAENKFYAFSRRMVFDGFRKIYASYNDEDKDKVIDLTNLNIGKKLSAKTVEINEHETKPPARFTQATLVGELEKSGVGRPSTYSTMANIAVDRGYANLVNRAFIPTEQGRKVSNELDKNFSEVINRDFTKNMEDNLDKIAEEGQPWQKVLRDFWPSFSSKVEHLIETTPPPPKEMTGEMCPECHNELEYKYSRKGQKFIGCSNYPNCRYVRSLNPPKMLEENCPDCGKKLLERKNKRGQIFIGCSGYPSCHFIGNYGPNNEIIKHIPKKKMAKGEEVQAESK